jgi:hypothetical protein
LRWCWCDTTPQCTCWRRLERPQPRAADSGGVEPGLGGRRRGGVGVAARLRAGGVERDARHAAQGGGEHLAEVAAQALEERVQSVALALQHAAKLVLGHGSGERGLALGAGAGGRRRAVVLGAAAGPEAGHAHSLGPDAQVERPRLPQVALQRALGHARSVHAVRLHEAHEALLLGRGAVLLAAAAAAKLRRLAQSEAVPAAHKAEAAEHLADRADVELVRGEVGREQGQVAVDHAGRLEVAVVRQRLAEPAAQDGAALLSQQLAELAPARLAHVDAGGLEEGLHVDGELDQVERERGVGRVHGGLGEVAQRGEHLAQRSQGRLWRVPQLVQQQALVRAERRPLAGRLRAHLARVLAQHAVQRGPEAGLRRGDLRDALLGARRRPVRGVEQRGAQQRLQLVVEQVRHAVARGEEGEHERHA